MPSRFTSRPCALRRFARRIFTCCGNGEADAPLIDPSWVQQPPYDYRPVRSPDPQADKPPSVRSGSNDIHGQNRDYFSAVATQPKIEFSRPASVKPSRITVNNFSTNCHPPIQCVTTAHPKMCFPPPQQLITPQIMPAYIPSPAYIPPPATSLLPQLGTPNNILNELSSVPADRYHWKTQFGELIFTPHSAKHATLPAMEAPVAMFNNISGHLSPWLSVNPQHPTNPQIDWDVACLPIWARHVEHDCLFREALQHPAICPESTNLEIHFDSCMTLSMPWHWEPIRINTPGPIRVGDVLYAVYNYFQTQMTFAEVGLIKQMGKRQYRGLCKSLERRVGRQPSWELMQQEYLGGFKRVDCLGATRKFWGLWIAADCRIRLGLIG